VTCQTKFRWTSASRSHVGLVRDRNEDACLDQPERGLWAVADGMGGHALGDVASRTVVESLNNNIPLSDELGQRLADARDRLQGANRKLRAEASIRGVPIIGSTVVALLACDRSCGYLWAGDSRIYLYRNGRLKQLTRDHSQLEKFRSQNNLDAEQAVRVPPRNMITRAVGAADRLEIDEATLKVNDGDVFLLCSDGLSNAVSEQEMRGELVAGNCQQAAESLVDLALERGGRDNISVVVVRADDLNSSDKTVLNPAL
jgi:protein phosphatase